MAHHGQLRPWLYYFLNWAVQIANSKIAVYSVGQVALWVILLKEGGGGPKGAV
jgi:hypothetical protein